MKNVLFTAPIAAGLILIAGAGVAHAEVTTSNDAKGDTTTSEGSSNSAVEAHAGQVNDGNIEGAGVKTVRAVVRNIPVIDPVTGLPVLDQWGNVVTEPVWGTVPIGSGPDSFEVDRP